MSLFKKFLAILLLIILILPTSSVSALTLQQTVNTIQATDPTLPTGVANPKGYIGSLLSELFYGTVDGAKNGKIKSQYIDYSGISAWTQSGSHAFYSGTGNVGIGTTSPLRKLHVNGEFSLTRSDNVGYINVSDPNGNGGGFINFRGLDSNGTIGTGATFSFQNNSGGYSMKIQADGNVGIGTTSPLAKLSLVGGVGPAGQIGIGGNMGTSSNKAGIFLGSNANYSGAGATGYFGLQGSPTGYVNDFAIVGASDSSTQRYLRIGYNTNDDPSNTFNPQVSINTYNGNVGIGTTSPSDLLTLSGATATLINLNGATTNYRGLKMSNSAGTEQWFAGANPSNNYVIRQGGATDIMTFSGGNVGIGTASPGAKLDVNGSITSNGNLIYSSFVDSSPTNMLANGNFEMGMNGWGSSLSIISQQIGGFYGSYSMKVVYSGAGDNHVVYSLPTIPQTLANRHYTFSFYAKADSAGSLAGAPFLQETLNWNGFCSVTDTTLTTSWKKFQGSCTIGTTSATTWRIVLRSTGDVGNNVYYDGIQVQDGTTGTEFSPFSVDNNGTAVFSNNVGIGTPSPGSKLSLGSQYADYRNRIAFYEGSDSSYFRGIGMLSSVGGNYGIGIWALAGAGGIPTDSNPALVVRDGGNVGIGTTDPGAPLHITSGNVTGESQIFNALRISPKSGAAHGSNGSSILFDSFTNYGGANPIGGIWSSLISGGNGGLNYAGALVFGTVSSGLSMPAERMRINDIGNVGIGTPSPGSDTLWGSPILDISGARGTQIIRTTNSAGIATLRMKGPDASGLDDWHINMYAGANSYINFQAKGGAAPTGLVLTNSGNVGIGTTSPIAKTTISRAGVSTLSTSDPTNNSHLTLAGTDTNVRLLMGVMNIAPWSALIQASYDNGGIYNGAEALSLNALGGNVGIGTTSPFSKLSFGSNDTAEATIGNKLAFYELSTGNALRGIGYMSPSVGIRGIGIWTINSNTAPAISNTSMFVADGGNVGIGTTDPLGYKLYVNGSFYANGSLGAAGAKTFIIQDPRYGDPNRRLTHAAIEGPEVAVFYRGEAKLENGETIVHLPDYFEALTRKEGRTVLLTCKNGWSPLFVNGEVENGKFSVKTTQDGEKNQIFYWEVKAVRGDIDPLAAETTIKDGIERNKEGGTVNLGSKLSAPPTSKPKVEVSMKPTEGTGASDPGSSTVSTGNTAPIVYKNIVAPLESTPTPALFPTNNNIPIAPTSQSHTLSWVVGVLVLLMGTTGFFLIRRRKSKSPK